MFTPFSSVENPVYPVNPVKRCLSSKKSVTFSSFPATVLSEGKTETITNTTRHSEVMNICECRSRGKGAYHENT
jgi:hypothetical protein